MLEAAGEPAAPTKRAQEAAARPKQGRRPRGLPRRRALRRAPRRAARSSATSTRAGSTTSCPGSRPRSSTSASTRTASCTSTRSCCRASRRSAAGAAAAAGPRITDLLKPGQEIVVQVVKDPLEDQGRAAVDGAHDRRALPGLRAHGRGRRRLAPARRTRSATACARRPSELDLGGGGAIIRTAAHGAKRADFERELQYLYKLHEVLQKRVEETPAPALVFQEADLSVRVVRDIFSRALRARDRRRREAAPPADLASSRAPRRSWSTASSSTRSDEPLFEHYGVEHGDRGRCSTRRVDLPSGGYLMIDYAEALTVIDVNTGSFTGRGKRGPARGHDHQDEPRGGRGGRAPAAAARHRRHHRHRLHRHGPRAQPRRGAEDAAQVARRGPHEDLRGRDLAARAGRDDAPERHRRRARDHDQALPDLRRRGRGQVRGDDRDRGRARSCATWSTRPATRPEAYLVRLQPAGHRAGSPPTARATLHALEEETGRHFHFEGSEGAAARPLRGHAGGHARGDRGARAAVPRRRGGARPHRRAAHVQRGRRGRQDRRLRDLGRQRRSPFVGEKKLVRIEEVGRTLAHAVLVGDEAEEAAEAAKERAKAARRAPPQAARNGEAGGDGRKPARGRPRRRGDRTVTEIDRLRRDARIEASAPWPQRRTAPFACQGRSRAE